MKELKVTNLKLLIFSQNALSHRFWQINHLILIGRQRNLQRYPAAEQDELGYYFGFVSGNTSGMLKLA